MPTARTTRSPGSTGRSMSVSRNSWNTCGFVISVRNDYPALRPFRYVESESPVPHEPGIVSWRDADGSELMPGTWGRQEPRVLMLTIEPARSVSDGTQDTLLIMFNGSDDPRTFHFPKIGKRRKTDWHMVLDTSKGNGRSEEVLIGGKTLEISRLRHFDGRRAVDISQVLVPWEAAI